MHEDRLTTAEKVPTLPSSSHFILVPTLPAEFEVDVQCLETSLYECKYGESYSPNQPWPVSKVNME
jgi:hypothetical protein